MHVRHLDLEVLGDGLLDALDAHLAAVEVEDVAQRFLGEVQRQLALGEAGEGQHLLQRPFQLAHVGADVLGNEERDFLGQRGRLELGLLKHDRHPHFQLGRLDRHGEAPAEARDQALLHSGDLLRVGIAGDDDLLVRLHQGVEGVEELLLRTSFVGEELDIVDQQKIQRVVVALELVEGFLLVGAHHVGNVLLGVDVANARLGPMLRDLVADRLHQVRLAEAHSAVDEQGVVGNPRVFRYLERRSAGELVRLPGDKAVEGVAAVQARALGERGHLAHRPLRRMRGARYGVGPAGEHQAQPELAPARVGGEPLDACREALAYQLEDKAVRGGEDQRVAGGARFGRERTDPRIELLRGELLLKPAQAGVPEGLHLLDWPKRA